MNKDDKRSQSIANGFLLIWALCFLAPMVLFYWFYLTSGSMPEKTSDWGVIGDFVGGISNPFISAMTFMALIFTILQNQKVLRINEQELVETRKEIELTREANQKQADEFRKQNEQLREESEVNAISLAMTRLSDAINEEWKKNRDPVSGDTLKQITTEHYQILTCRAEQGFTLNKNTVDEFMPYVVAYTDLLINLYLVYRENPMYQAMKVAQAQCLAQLKAYGYFEPHFSKDDLNTLSEILEGYDHRLRDFDL